MSDEEPKQLGVIRSMDDLEQLCRLQVGALQITYAILDQYTGFTDAYFSKLLAASPYSINGKRGAKRGFSSSSFDAAMIGCCFDLIAVENPEKVERLREWMAKKMQKRMAGDRMLSAASHKPITIKLSLRHMRKLGKLGGKARLKKISTRKRRLLAKHAAKMRWSKPKLVEVPTLTTNRSKAMQPQD